MSLPSFPFEGTVMECLDYGDQLRVELSTHRWVDEDLMKSVFGELYEFIHNWLGYMITGRNNLNKYLFRTYLFVFKEGVITYMSKDNKIPHKSKFKNTNDIEYKILFLVDCATSIAP